MNCLYYMMWKDSSYQGCIIKLIMYIISIKLRDFMRYSGYTTNISEIISSISQII